MSPVKSGQVVHIGKLPSPVRSELRDYFHTIPNTRGSVSTTPDEYTGAMHLKGAIDSAGRPYSRVDVRAVKKLMQEHHIPVDHEQAASLLEQWAHGEKF